MKGIPTVRDPVSILDDNESDEKAICEDTVYRSGIHISLIITACYADFILSSLLVSVYMAAASTARTGERSGRAGYSTGVRKSPAF